MRSICLLLTPFLLDIINVAAKSHLSSETLLRSKTVPTVTVNWSRQCPHSYTPRRCALPLSLPMRSHAPQ
jgi:hypothetical protein